MPENCDAIDIGILHVLEARLFHRFDEKEPYDNVCWECVLPLDRETGQVMIKRLCELQVWLSEVFNHVDIWTEVFWEAPLIEFSIRCWTR